MGRKRIAIACQGGGSQCAFVAGALKALFAGGVHDRHQIVGLSGTSGGALTAALAWYGLLRRTEGDDTPIEQRVVAFWRELTAQTPQEIAFDQSCVQTLRLIERGLLPSFATSPSALTFRLWSELMSRMLGRREFTDLGALVSKHLDFELLPSLLERDGPVLLVGACDVVKGTFKIFTSLRGEIGLDCLLASAAIPNLFPAVWVDGHAYWDGIFSSNPPIVSFLRECMMGKDKLPEEIWIVQVNRPVDEDVPEVASDIFDRRNRLAGNLSLQHELQLVAMVNTLIEEKALTQCFRERFGLDTCEPIAVRFIRMSERLQHLDYPSKLSRQPAHIAELMADGEAQGRRFLEQLRCAPAPLHVMAPEVRLELQ